MAFMEAAEQTHEALDLLRQKLEEARLRNPNWSLRAFAQKIGISSGSLSEILQGKRPLSFKNRQKIIQRLGLSPREQKRLLSDQAELTKSRRPSNYHIVSSDSFHMIADWWHYGILNLIKTKDFQPRPTWIANRLGLPKMTVEQAIQRLRRLGFLEVASSGALRRKKAKLNTSDDVIDLSIRRSHLEDLKLMERSLTEISVPEREHGSITFAFKMKDMAKAKEMLRQFQDEFSDSFESDEADEVYRLSLAFFPLTRINKPGGLDV
jgi:uncharacterized protein (TIGR02147 family)